MLCQGEGGHLAHQDRLPVLVRLVLFRHRLPELRHDGRSHRPQDVGGPEPSVVLFHLGAVPEQVRHVAGRDGRQSRLDAILDFGLIGAEVKQVRHGRGGRRPDVPQHHGGGFGHVLSSCPVPSASISAGRAGSAASPTA